MPRINDELISRGQAWSRSAKCRNPTRSWFRTLGCCITAGGSARVCPLSPQSRPWMPASPASLWLRGLARKGWAGEGQEEVGPKIGRGAAARAGVAMMKCIHPLVKVTILPNLLCTYAVAPADWPGDARRDPGWTLRGQKLKYTLNEASGHDIHKLFQAFS